MASVLELPQDLWCEVLSKLPAGDVVRFRRLSKFHRDLISTHGFIRKHYQESATKNNVIFSGKEFNGIDGFDRVVNFPTANSTRRLIQPRRHSELVDSCMGILCYKNSDSLILWNPLNKNLSKIPLGSRQGSFILVHDSATDDIKVILIKDGRRVFEIYSSKMKSWITGFSIEGFLSECSYIVTPELPVYVEGTNSLNWWFRGKAILSYNFSTQTFKTFLRPEPFQKIPEDNIARISSLGGCLSWYNNRSWNDMDVWTMKEHGVSKSWTMIHRISHTIKDASYGMEPVVFIDNGSRLVVFCPTHGLYVADVGSGSLHITDLKMQLKKQSDKYYWSPKLLVFTPTLRKP